MTSIERMEHYFHELLDQAAGHQTDHPLAHANARFALYSTLRSSCKGMSAHLEQSGRLFYGRYTSYHHILKQFSSLFSIIATLQDDQLDFYVRTITVEQCVMPRPEAFIGKKSQVAHMLGFLVEGMITMLFDSKEPIRMRVRDTIEQFAKPCFWVFLPFPLVQLSEDRKLRGWLKQALLYYEKIEKELDAARQGIVSRDTKMLLTLRHLKIGVGKAMLTMLMDKTPTMQSSYTIPPVSMGKYNTKEIRGKN